MYNFEWQKQFTPFFNKNKNCGTRWKLLHCVENIALIDKKFYHSA